MGLEGLLRRVALAATFRHATWGPDELFYGELYSSRQRALQADPRPARHPRRVLGLLRARAGRERPLRLPALLAARQRLPLAHASAPRRSSSRSRTPTPRFAELVDAGGGLERVPRRARGDPGRRPRPDRGQRAAAARRASSARAGGCCSRTRADPGGAELAVCPSSRAGGRLRARRGPGAPRACTRPSASGCASSTASTCSPGSSSTASRCCAATPTARRRAGATAVVERDGARAALPARGRRSRDRRGAGWDLDGDPAALAAQRSAAAGSTRETYPNALGPAVVGAAPRRTRARS